MLNQLIDHGIITVVSVRLSYDLADPFTKALSRDLMRTTCSDTDLKHFDTIHQ